MAGMIRTALIAIVIRESRRRLKGYLVSGSQVEKLLALLVESGAVYCAMWVSGLLPASVDGIHEHRLFDDLGDRRAQLWRFRSPNTSSGTSHPS